MISTILAGPATGKSGNFFRTSSHSYPLAAGFKGHAMRLIGMLDSPYVRRVAISLRLMELPFSHEALSVFRNYDAFAAINPVVKAPTFVTDDGVVLMDSALMLEYLERLLKRF